MLCPSREGSPGSPELFTAVEEMEKKREREFALRKF